MQRPFCHRYAYKSPLYHDPTQQPNNRPPTTPMWFWPSRPGMTEHHGHEHDYELDDLANEDMLASAAHVGTRTCVRGRAPYRIKVEQAINATVVATPHMFRSENLNKGTKCPADLDDATGATFGLEALGHRSPAELLQSSADQCMWPGRLSPQHGPPRRRSRPHQHSRRARPRRLRPCRPGRPPPFSSPSSSSSSSTSSSSSPSSSSSSSLPSAILTPVDVLLVLLLMALVVPSKPPHESSSTPSGRSRGSAHEGPSAPTTTSWPRRENGGGATLCARPLGGGADKLLAGGAEMSKHQSLESSGVSERGLFLPPTSPSASQCPPAVASRPHLDSCLRLCPDIRPNLFPHAHAYPCTRPRLTPFSLLMVVLG